MDLLLKHSPMIFGAGGLSLSAPLHNCCPGYDGSRAKRWWFVSRTCIAVRST
jgi:hypothetical protein